MTSNQPDDPLNPHRKKPRPYEDAESKTAEFMRMHDEVRDRTHEIVARGELISGALKSFLGYCWMAETDALAKDTMLVVAKDERTGHQNFWYERRTPTDPAWMKRLAQAEAEARSARNTVELQQAELIRLRKQLANATSEILDLKNEIFSAKK